MISKAVFIVIAWSYDPVGHPLCQMHYTDKKRMSYLWCYMDEESLTYI